MASIDFAVAGVVAVRGRLFGLGVAGVTAATQRQPKTTSYISHHGAPRLLASTAIEIISLESFIRAFRYSLCAKKDEIKTCH